MSARDDHVFHDLLGRAVAACWGEMPQETQQKLYETAVGLGSSDNNELFREQLAVYLHNHHPRTERQVPVPRDVSAADQARTTR